MLGERKVTPIEEALSSAMIIADKVSPDEPTKFAFAALRGEMELEEFDSKYILKQIVTALYIGLSYNKWPKGGV